MYVRGKFIEGGIIGLSSWLVLNFWEANYAFSLAALIGLSVFVPFVGAIAVTIP
ncbi:MAG: AI-2E family transporter [Gammaproteobacteria bacterium WSBS_2016_MAG_OTU1]